MDNKSKWEIPYYMKHMLTCSRSLMWVWAILLASQVPLHAQPIYVATGWGDQILSFSPNGNMSVFANYTGVNEVAVDGQGNVYASGEFGPVTRYSPTGQGTAVGNYATFWFDGAAADASGNLYIATQGNGIMKMDPAGNWSTFVASVNANGLALDNHGNLFAAFGSTIMEYNPLGQGRVFTSQAPSGTLGIALDSQGNLYAADFSYGQIEKFDPSGHETLFASSGLSGPEGMAFDNNGNLYVANRDSGTIEKFDQNGNGTVFASGLYDPGYMAVQPVPEPLSLSLLALGSGALLICRRARPLLK